MRVRADYLGRYRSVSGQSECLLLLLLYGNTGFRSWQRPADRRDMFSLLCATPLSPDEIARKVLANAPPGRQTAKEAALLDFEMSSPCGARAGRAKSETPSPHTAQRRSCADTVQAAALKVESTGCSA